nr:DEAD/DEAH box helicase [Intrasporangium sp.]
MVDPALIRAVTPRPPQQSAVDSLMSCFAAHSRAQVRMACGVGKTHVGIFTASATAAQRVVVAVPSLSLVDQTLASWMPLLAKGTQTVAVCSADGLFTHAGRAVGPRVTTTNPARIGFLLQQDTPTLIVTTYQSLVRLAAAVRATGTVIDLLVLDEAHHLTGHLQPGQRAALDDAQLPAARRLAMTATPVIATQADAAGAAGFDPFTSSSAAATAISMDDEQLFGPVAHLYTTRQAIDDGYLCDYEVMVVSRIDTPFNRQRLPLAALAAAANERGVARALSFHNWVADARAFTNLLNVSSHDTVRFVADTINGTTPTPARRKILTRLAGQCGPGVVRVVTAAKCLREGVDVCAVDAVLFASPRSNTVEIVQAVGRALRIHPGKERGTIILPLLLPPGAVDDDEQLTASHFAHVWKVLRALNAHDPRISESLIRAARPDQNPRRRGLHAEARQMPDWLHMVGGVDADTILGRLVSPVSSQWDTMFATLVDAVDQVGSAHRIKNTHTHSGRRIGDWVVTQRHNYHRGVMDPARIDQLEQLPGWTWRPESILDHRLVDRLEEFAAAAGTCRDAATGESTYPTAPGEARIGRWLAQTRLAHREGRLEKSVAARLVTLPGWTWEPLSGVDRAGVDALKAFVAWEGTAAVPVGHIEDGIDLAAWLDRNGSAYLAKQLSPELHEEILAVCPTDAKGGPLFAWDANRLRAEAGLTALRQYVASGGAVTSMPTTHQEQVDGLVINLYQWCARMRWLAGRDSLDAAMRAALSQVPGWVWSLREAKSRFGPPITLPAGVPHGRAHTRSHFGCPCQACDEAARDSQTAFKRQQMDNLTAGWVTSPSGAARVKGLMAGNPWAVPMSVAAAACLPRTLLGSLMSDPSSTRVPPWIASRLERLTPDQLREWHREGTRGRSASRAYDLGDRVVHQQALARLRAAGWTDAQIGSALGYRGSATHATRSDPSAAVVHALFQLLRALGPGAPVPSWLSPCSPAPELEQSA